MVVFTALWLLRRDGVVSAGLSAFRGLVIFWFLVSVGDYNMVRLTCLF